MDEGGLPIGGPPLNPEASSLDYLTMCPELHAYSIYSRGAGSTRVRMYDWFDYLSWSVHRHTYAGLPSANPRLLIRHPREVLAAEWNLRNSAPTGAHVLVSREVSPASAGGREVDVLTSAERGVYDFDDALFCDRSFRRRVTGGDKKIRRAVVAAETIIAGNDYLAEWAAQYNRDIRVIPSCIDPDKYVVSRRNPSRGPTIVWLGSSSTEVYLEQLIPELLNVHRQTGATLKIISSDVDNPRLSPLAPMLRRVGWTEETFAAELSDADVAIAPLDDTPYARGKCAYKLLQYAAAGLPIVGSPVGANALALSRFDGVSVTKLADWGDAVVGLLEECELTRRNRIRIGQRAVRAHYSFKAWAPQWSKAVVG